MKKALLLVARGSRQEEANADLYHVVADRKLRGQFAIVEAAFLEFAEPNIEEGGRRCVALEGKEVEEHSRLHRTITIPTSTAHPISAMTRDARASSRAA